MDVQVNGTFYTLDETKQEIIKSYQKTLDAVIEMGSFLYAVRVALHDDENFKAYCAELPFSRSSAYNYIKVYEHSLTHKLDDLKRFSLSALYTLPVDTETLEIALYAVDEGKPITQATVQEIMKTIGVDDPQTVEGWVQVADSDPVGFVEDVLRGAVYDPLREEDVPLTDANPTLLAIISNEVEYERMMRHKTHRTPTDSVPTIKLDGVIQDWVGTSVMLQVTDVIPTKMIGFRVKLIIIQADDEDTLGDTIALKLAADAINQSLKT